VQVPIDDERAQLRQAPAHASPQQTPSTQNELMHSSLAVQACPFGFGPQLPFWQPWPGTQSLSLVQVPLQAPATQRKGAQLVIPGMRQVPSPLQVPAVFRRFPLQEGATQTVSAANSEHPPTPSQLPV